ncbi:MAG: hypothetical protein JWM34_1671 [Ilumatobacteraceae bacterium]|nr:hypothetical protein [Ilumatobacteraceae bacterium]
MGRARPMADTVMCQRSSDPGSQNVGRHDPEKSERSEP